MFTTTLRLFAPDNNIHDVSRSKIHDKTDTFAFALDRDPNYWMHNHRQGFAYE